jgi:predicted PurR-regulated permease PerM
MDRRSDDDTSDPPNSVSAPNGIHAEPRLREATWVERLAAAALALLLVVLCVLVVRPFLSAALWAVVLCTSTWGLFQRVGQSLGRHRSLAALLMTLALTVAIVGPFALVGFSLVEQVKDAAGVVRQAMGSDPFPLAAGLNKVPIVGPQLADYYRNLLGGEISVVEQLKRVSGPVGRTILEWSKAFGKGLWQLCLSLLIGFFFYRDGEELGARIDNLATRIAGPERGTRLLRLAQDTCIGVVYGVVVTGIIHAVLMGVGLLIAGVPGALVLGFLTFLLSALPGGAALIWIPAALWLFSQNHVGWALFLSIWALLFNFLVGGALKPILIAESGHIPLLLVFAGIFGGAAAFGLIGVFLGPALLAVGYSLLDDVSSRPA